ncbi:hypothetical protein ACIQM4_23465 [Streptomyces sp. NPDC091272]|uniref:hypothetical protein n=1 Tax=Streptomyces sp. NPDC091272 TaxID=3365981 RepID=UPI00381A2474
MADAPRSHRSPYRRRALAALPALVAAGAAVFVVCAALAALMVSGLPGAVPAPDARPPSSTAETEGLVDGTDSELRAAAAAVRRTTVRDGVRGPVRVVRTPFPGNRVERPEIASRVLAQLQAPVPHPVRRVVLRC